MRDDPASGWSGCSVANLAHDWDRTFAAAGHGTGYGAVLSLISRTDVFSAGYYGTPDDLVAAQAKLRGFHAASDTASRVASLPLTPANLVAPALAGEAQPGGTLTVDPGVWDAAPGRVEGGIRAPAGDAVERRWVRCRGECEPIAGATGTSLALVASDDGAVVRAEVKVRNRWGESEWQPTTAVAVKRAADPRLRPRR